MTYTPGYEIGPKSPGVWKEVRRLEAEIERLRKTLREWQEGYPGELIAEVEGLRAHYHDPTTGMATHDHAEVERLQEHAESLGTALLESRAEVEKLFNELKLTQEELMKEQDENERLRDQVEGLLSVEFENRKEIERLQADLVLRQNEKELLHRLAQQNGAEVERLRLKVVMFSKDAVNYSREVERLRAEEVKLSQALWKARQSRDVAEAVVEKLREEK